ncbi:hypothetical protein HMPREF3198_00897 [Winkia neuii]|nr:hypothetical protein HMPREF3198_00897 [Winkia neuii]
MIQGRQRKIFFTGVAIGVVLLVAEAAMVVVAIVSSLNGHPMPVLQSICTATTIVLVVLISWLFYYGSKHRRPQRRGRNMSA